MRRLPHHLLKKVMVVIDPGHGGKDPGAISLAKTSIPKAAQEKWVTLAIAKQLKALIEQEKGMQAVLTRDSDH